LSCFYVDSNPKEFEESKERAVIMAKSNDTHPGAPKGAPDPQPEELTFQRPEGLISLIRRYPQYDPGFDVRDRRMTGKKAAPIHGLLLGAKDLPATIADPATGELRPWNVLVVELLQPCPVKDAGKTPAEDRRRIAKPPEHIIITSTAALDSIRERFGLDAAMNAPERVYELYCEPVASVTRAGLSLWVFDAFEMGKPRARSTMQRLNPFSDIGRAAAALGSKEAPALPEGALPFAGASSSQAAAPSRSPV
jgi:hypothetical protein